MGEMKPTIGRRRGVAHGALLGLLAMVSASVMLFAIPQASAAFKFLAKGSDVPDFSIRTTAGEDVTLGALKEGKTSVILFWATWSPRSIEELKFLEKVYKEHKDKGLKVVGINVNHLTFTVEDEQAIETVVKETGVTFPIAIDRGLELYNQVGVVATPSTLVMDSSGKVAYEVSSFLSATGEQLKETVEVALGVRTAPAATAVVEDTSYKPNRSAMLYFNLGRNLLKMGSREKAVDKLLQAVGADAKYTAPRVLLGHLYLDQAIKDHKAAEEAVRLFGEALAADPKSVSALSGMGEALLRTGKLDDAEARFGEAIKLDATYTPALTGMAAVLSKKGKYDEGMVKFQEALDLNPLNPEAYMKRSGAWEAQGKSKEAVGDLRRAVELLLGLGLKSEG